MHRHSGPFTSQSFSFATVNNQRFKVNILMLHAPFFVEVNVNIFKSIKVKQIFSICYHVVFGKLSHSEVSDLLHIG